MRIGVLTGGGDCSGLNAAIRGVAKTLIVNSQAEIFGIEDGFLGLIEQRVRPLSVQDFDGLIHLGGTILGTCNRASPFDYRGENRVNDIVSYYHELNLDCIVALGGDGTMSLCHALSQHGMNFVGIPKTIDNDLFHTDRTFGFDTAVSIVAEAVDRLHTTGKSHHRVMILETMGRYAGWIALYGGVAGDADMILVPEYPFHLEYIVEVLKERSAKHQHSVIVVAEGAIANDGHRVIRQTVNNSPDPVRLGGIGYLLQHELENRIDAEIRTTVLGHVQRGGPPTVFDRIFATNLGCFAADLVLHQQYGCMVCVKGNQLQSIALKDVADQTRTIPEDDMTLLSALDSGISFGDPSLGPRLTSLHKRALHLR